jgi:corrinoid protein of di/trimethylamine methyltransferase
MGEYSDLVIEGEDEELVALVEKRLGEGADPNAIIDELTDGIRVIGDQFENGEVFLPELMLAAEAMQAAIQVLKPSLLEAGGGAEEAGKVIIGTVEGDIHDIGKTIVGAFLSVSGFDVVDLGRDIPTKEMVAKAEELDADVIAASSLLTSTMPASRDIVELLKKKDIRHEHVVVVGGAPVTEEWAEHIGADGTAKDAPGAAKLCRELVDAKRTEQAGLRPD